MQRLKIRFQKPSKAKIEQGIFCETKLQDKYTKISVSIEKNGKVSFQHINYVISRFKEWGKWSFSENSMTVSCPNGSPQNTHTIILYRQSRSYLGIYMHTCIYMDM